MGHALNGSIQDVADPLPPHARASARSGSSAPTTPGIATQTQVEKQLDAEGTSREELGREAFVARVWEWREQYGAHDRRAVPAPRRLAATTRTSASRSTRATCARCMKVFVDLYDKGLIYRDHYMVNWDPGMRSAISDLEVEDREVDDTLYPIAYPLEGGGEMVTVATVRPETMLADTAVAVQPGRRALPRTWSARTRDPAARRPRGCRSSPTTTSSPSSAPAR